MTTFASFPSREQQMAALNKVAMLAAARQINVAMTDVDHEIVGLMPAYPTLPPNKAIQIVCIDGTYDVWTKGGTDLAETSLTAEQAAERLVKQYMEYKVKFITDRGV